MGVDHPECAAQPDTINDHLMTHGYLNLMPRYLAPEATREQLQRAHAAHHVAEMEVLVPATGCAQLDPHTCMNPFSLIASRHAAGAAGLATDLVVSSEVGRAFCAGAHRATMLNATPRWDFVFSTTSSSAFATSSDITASPAWRWWISMCITATAVKIFPLVMARC